MMKCNLILLSLAIFTTVNLEAKTVKASSFGFNDEDATAALQSAINSDAATVIVDNIGKNWIIKPIQLRSNLELIFADGVTVIAKKGEFHPLNASLFEAVNSQNIKITGQGEATLKMNGDDYRDKTLYKFSEWRNIITLRGCENITVSNLILKDSGGDAIYIAGGKIAASENVLIDHITAIDNHRQGISVISAKNLTIKNSKFINTFGTAPMAGIDLEPNHADNLLENCRIENCEIYDNKGYGILMHLNPLTSKSKPVSIIVDNVKMLGNVRGGLVINCSAGISQASGNITINHCTISNNQTGQLIIRNQRNDGFSIEIDNSTIDGKAIAKAPIQILTETPVPVGKINFQNVTVSKSTGQEISFDSSETGIDISGELKSGNQTINLANWSKEQDKAPVTSPFVPVKLDTRKLTPASEKPGVSFPAGAYFRGNITFLQYAKAGETITVKFIYKQVGKNTATILSDFIAPDGRKIERIQISSDKEFTFTAKESGVYSFVTRTSGMAVIFNSNSPGHGVAADNASMFTLRGRLYFTVPAGLELIQIRIGGFPGEFINAKIYNGKNELMGELLKVELAKIFRHTRVFPEQTEIWSMDLSMREDAFIQFGEGLIPVLSPSPETLLKD